MSESCQNEEEVDCDGTLCTTRGLCMNETRRIDTKRERERRSDRVCVDERKSGETAISRTGLALRWGESFRTDSRIMRQQLDKKFHAANTCEKSDHGVAPSIHSIFRKRDINSLQ